MNQFEQYRTCNFKYKTTHKTIPAIAAMHGLHRCCSVWTNRFNSHTAEEYGTPEGTFLFQYLPEKKSKQKELERKPKQ